MRIKNLAFLCLLALTGCNSDQLSGQYNRTEDAKYAFVDQTVQIKPAGQGKNVYEIQVVSKVKPKDNRPERTVNKTYIGTFNPETNVLTTGDPMLNYIVNFDDATLKLGQAVYNKQ